jgi:phospholipid/cholesterol/gamma-HCH transport system ATP-binding protein
MIRFENVVKRFGERTVLDHISFTVPTGQILFVLGTSGTGKSVLLKLIVGLIRNDQGQIWIEDQETSGLTEDQFTSVRKTCGMVFQQPALFDSLSVYENIAYGLRRHWKLSEDVIRERVRESLRLVNLKDISDKYPAEISYGMQKRVSLARTVALKPRILLFDEPTTGLDPITTNSINQLILNLSKELKTTSIVVSHDMHCALAIADQILVLDKGSIVEKGSPAALKESRHPLVMEFLSEVQDL